MARPKINNAEYFSHDKGMRNDAKIKALRKRFGHVGYSVFNMMLEVLCGSDFFEYDISELEIELLSGDFDVEPYELVKIFDYCIRIKLFDKNDAVVFSNGLKKRLQGVLDKRNREQTRFTKQNEAKQDVSAAETTQSKVKYSIVNESKENFEEEVVTKRTQIEIDEAIDEYIESLKNENEEPQKSCAKKGVPDISTARLNVSQTRNWRNVLEHYQIDESKRELLFKIFYEQKEDEYNMRFPTWTDVAKNFYFWAKINLNIEQRENTSKDGNTKYKNTNKQRTNYSTAKEGVSDLAEKSSEFLQQLTSEVNP